MLNNLKALDFFCGAGGVTCGLRQAGIKVLGGIDIDTSCKKTYEENNPDAKFIPADISLLTFKQLEKEISLKKGDDEMIYIACSPCQYYTNLKTDKTKSNKTRLLLEDFREFVDYYRPGFVLIENVPGLETTHGSPLNRFKKYLKGAGYKYADKVINAKYFGVPQNRRRYVLLATRLDVKVELPRENKSFKKTVKDVIGDKFLFPEIDAGHKDITEFIHSAARLSEINLTRIKSTTKNGGSRKDWAENEKLQLECYKNHEGHTDVYGRMKWNAVSPTVTTKFCSLSNGRYGHPEQNRAISLREGATLQSFPLDYKFIAIGQGTIARMIGNAVPPELARRIGQQIKSIFNSRSN